MQLSSIRGQQDADHPNMHHLANEELRLLAVIYALMRMIRSLDLEIESQSSEELHDKTCVVPDKTCVPR